MPIDIIWRKYGDGVVRIHQGAPVFPKEPKNRKKPGVPGIYRLTLDNGYTYIGKAGDLPQRFSNYRKPTQGTEQEYIVHYALLEACGATVDVFTDGDLSCGSVLSMLERAAIQAAMGPLLNKKRDRPVDPYYLKLKMRYHKEMLASVTKELASIESLESPSG
jgi:hypothetical protein